MKRSLLLPCLILATSLSYGQGLIPVSSDQQKDLNESVFIKAMDEANSGTIPFPFENLVKSLGNKIEDTNHLLVPKGRSLVKEKADYENPRIIVAPFNTETQSGSLKKFKFDASELFIGYAPNSKSLEVISFNRKTNQFDFFIIEDYEKGKTPKVVSNPALCLSCHQNRAPIFPQLPWSEMTGNAGGELLKNGATPDCAKPSYENDIVNEVIKANHGKKSFEGISLETLKKTSVCEAQSFDANVTVAAGLVSNKAYCEALCVPTDKACIANFLKLQAGLPLTEEELSTFGNIDDKVAKLIATPSHRIPNRNPYTGVGYRSVINADQITDLNPEFILKEKIGSTYDATYKGFSRMFNVGGLHAFDFPEKDSSFVNPATPRPSENTLDILKERLGLAKSLKEKVSALADICLEPRLFTHDDGGPIASLELVNIIKNSKMQDALKSWPGTFELERTLSTLINSGDTEEECLPKDPILAVYAHQDLSQVVSLVAKDKVDHPKGLFLKYCSQCHDPEKGFIQLPLKSLEDMANYQPRFSDKGPIERLSKNIMPPEGAPQPTAEERKELVDVLKELKKR